ncbi:MAG TPA: acetyl-CoA decarbonylase/synthase complex subunit gamma [Methanomicrobiales archaeon]|jgi:acetyl-CoA decarbonylase/synthase complex subunit gamma|nr:acetyl-CoA decarbonylase/synthase complex subunit gamma [Methanomicrobiales archaeon]
MKQIGPMKVYPLLPKTNCGICGPRTCMGFAVQLCERSASLGECTPLLEGKYRENLVRLREIFAPPVREVVIGTGDHKVTVGGALVLMRHELRYTNPPAIAVVVDDSMPAETVMKRVQETNYFHYKYIGKILTLDAIAIRSADDTPEKFTKLVDMVARSTQLPLVLWAHNPAVIEEGVKLVQARRPLLYPATRENWRQMGELALRYRCPLGVYDHEIRMLRSIVKTLRVMGVDDLVLDPGCGFRGDLQETVSALTQIRIAAIREEDELLGYPLAGAPATLWEKLYDEGKDVVRWKEACLAAMMVVRYVDLLMVSSASKWSTLPLVVLRNNIYNDPRRPVSVDPGLRTFGEPDPKEAPVFLTSNFALTYYTVLSDIEKLDCHLLVVDTEGMSVDSAVAGRKFTAAKVAEVIASSGIADKVAHRTLIIPGLAARLKGDIEDATGWDVVVGPRDSSAIPGYVKAKWYGQDHTPGWTSR